MTVKPIIFCPTPSKRLDYVCSFIFSQLADLPYELVHSMNNLGSGGHIIEYSPVKTLHHSCKIVPKSGMKDGESVDPPSLEGWSDSDETFDIFHWVFYHLSLAEEYNSSSKDAHGRMVCRSSWLGKNDLHRVPVVDRAVQRFFQNLNDHFETDIYAIKKRPQSELTIDVDQFLAYSKKPLWRIGGSVMKDLLSARWTRLHDRLSVAMGKKADPYDRIIWMIDEAEKRGLPVHTFFLMKGLSKFDRQNELKPSNFSFLKGRSSIGLHPSYLSVESPGQLKREKEVLEELVGQKIRKSRFHFLRLKMPKSYHRLIECDIREDYTLSWSDDIGFRAGTAHDFMWFDLEKDEATTLKIHPVVAMDVILKNTLNLTPSEAIRDVGQLIEEVGLSGGCARVIWHNSSFDPTEGWGGWENVFIRILDLLRIN